MNLESNPSKKPVVNSDDFSFDDFDFKPLTSGLGFNQGSKTTTEIKPSFIERQVPTPVMANPAHVTTKKDSNVYQNDLSIFYGQQSVVNSEQAVPEIKSTIKEFRLASKSQRISAYVLDLAFIVSCLGLILTIMSRFIEMDLLQIWFAYPNEITPLIVTLFVGFYLLYFSIFEKSGQSTIGKSFFNLRVVNLENEEVDFSMLFLRTFISLVNFVSLGLFSYFDLQNKISDSKVVRIK